MPRPITVCAVGPGGIGFESITARACKPNMGQLLPFVHQRLSLFHRASFNIPRLSGKLAGFDCI
jgi:hypothetical protein